MKSFLFTLFILISQLNIAQTTILWDDDPGVSYSNDTIDVDATESSFNVYMHCQNTSSSSIEIIFRRIILSSSVTFSDQFCDNNLCYSCSGTDWTSPTSTVLQAGDSSLMKPQFYFPTAGTAVIRYFVLDHNYIKLDSVDININCSVGDNELSIIKPSIQIYPNPANENVNIRIDEINSQFENRMLKIHNIIGKEVMSINSSKFQFGNVELKTDQFKQGVYIVSLY